MLESSTVLIADGQTLVREGMKMLVSGVLPTATFVEIGDAGSLLSAAASMPSARLGMIDLNLPGMQGGSHLLEMAQRFPRLPLIVVSSFTSLDLIRRTTNIPTVYAFVSKSSDLRTMHGAIEAAAQGRRWSSESAANSSANGSGLTPRQQEICMLLRQGMSNKRIAGALGISAGTVKNHITEIFKILNATNRTQVAQRVVSGD